MKLLLEECERENHFLIERNCGKFTMRIKIIEFVSKFHFLSSDWSINSPFLKCITECVYNIALYLNNNMKHAFI